MLTVKKWVVAAAEVEKPEVVYFAGSGNTKEEANAAMYAECREMLKDRAKIDPRPDDPPVTLNDGVNYIDEQLLVVGPFEVEIKL